MTDVHGAADLDCHQVFADGQRSGPRFARLGDQILHRRRANNGVCRQQHDVRVDSQFRFDLREHLAGRLGGRMKTNDAARRCRFSQQFGLRHRDFMHDDIGALREPNQIFVAVRVAGNDDGPAAVVDPVAERRLDERTMENVEGSDLHAVAFIDDALRDVLGANGDTRQRQPFTVVADTDVCAESLLQRRHHGLGTSRAEDLHRSRSTTERRRQPAGQPQIREADRVIGVQMRKKYGRHGGQRNVQLPQSLRRAATAVEQQFLTAGFDQRARSEPFDSRRRAAGAQHHHPDARLGSERRRGRDQQRTEGDDERRSSHVCVKVEAGQYVPRSPATRSDVFAGLTAGPLSIAVG